MLHLSTELILCVFFFFFNDTATTEIYTLSLHDALPISFSLFIDIIALPELTGDFLNDRDFFIASLARSEEHTSELQSRPHLVCRLLLEKKKRASPQPQVHFYANYQVLSS